MKVIMMWMKDAARLTEGEAFSHQGETHLIGRIKYDFCPYSQRFVAAVHVIPAPFLKKEDSLVVS